MASGNPERPGPICIQKVSNGTAVPGCQPESPRRWRILGVTDRPSEFTWLVVGDDL
jgi:hypothetical protein